MERLEAFPGGGGEPFGIFVEGEPSAVRGELARAERAAVLYPELEVAGERQELGFGLAVAIFLDATVVRLVLVPAAMHLLGEWNWWLPAALARLAPGAARPATK
jgi:hypothetical protein